MNRRHALRRSLISCAVAGASVGALAQSQPPDDDALELADKAPAATAPKPPAASPWQIFGQVAGSNNGMRNPSDTYGGTRAALDLRYDGNLGSGLRAVLSDRLDIVHQNVQPKQRNINSLREAYVSWRATPTNVLDLGRVNIRHGAAWGFNPTDYFRGQSLRFIPSPDPASLRTNRLGTVVGQVQTLLDDSSFSAAFSPRLASRPSSAGESLDLGATNGSNRWLLTASHKFSPSFNPELLLHGGGGTGTQVGLNVSGLLNDSTVGYVEYSGGKGRSLAAQALGLNEGKSWQNRAALGVTYTTPFNLSLTAEADFSSAALDRDRWNAIRQSSPLAALQLLQTVQSLQDIPTRRGAFFYVTWRDAFVRRLDVSGFLRADLTTHSRQQWLETRYHWDKAELALQYQLYSGKSDSVFGLVPQKQVLELSAMLYF